MTGLKIISVIMSVLLWFYVINQGDLTPKQNVIDTGLRYINLGEGLSVIGPDKVSVKLWGLFQEPDDIIAYVDLSNLKKGTYQLPVQVEPVKGAMFTTVEPDKVEVTIKGEYEKIVSVSHTIVRNPDIGYKLSDVVKSPDKCLVKGEEHAVNKVSTVICELDLSNISGIHSITVPLKALDESGRVVPGIRLVPDKIDVYVAVNQSIITKSVTVVPTIAGKLPDNLQLLKTNVVPNKVSVIVPATMTEVLENLETESIDLSTKTESFAQEVKIVVPDGVKVYPSKVLVEIDISRNPEDGVEE